jgi:tetratricopeptide (TPR) repeat protein
MEALMASMPAGGFSPEVMRAAQAQASKMSASDWQAAQQKLGGLSPEELRKQAAAANSQLAARQAYVISACRTLKDEGNKLHGQGKWAEAAAKYERAHSNLSPPANAGGGEDSNTSTPADPAAAAAAASDEGRELRRACALNLASCCLQQGKHARAVGLCDEVLREDASNVKALYRRGQALQGLGKLRGAERDLSEAVRRTEAAGGGEAQLAPIRARLAEVKAARVAAGDEGEEEDEDAQPAAGKGSGAASAAAKAAAKAAAAAPKARTVSGSCVVEEALSDDDDEEGRVEEATAVPAAKAEKAKAAPAAAPQPPAAMREAIEAMRRDPDAVKRAAQAMRDMSPEELAAACNAAGAANGGGAPGGVSPEQARMAAEMMRSMKPEDVARMAEQAAAMAGAGGAAAGAGMPAPGAMPDEGQMRALAEGLGKMSDAELEQLAAAAGGAGFGGGTGPGGAQVTPSMMRMAAQMMRTMKPEDMAAMQRMAAAAGGVGAGGAAAAGGSGGASSSSAAVAAASTPTGGLPPDLAKRMMEPAMVEQMLGMLQSMDERSLAEMLKGAMPGAAGASDEAALKLARQLKKITPRQARALATMASGVQRAVEAARKAREALAGRGMLIVALAVLVVAVVLRLWGWGA